MLKRAFPIAFVAAAAALIFGLILRRHLLDDVYITLSYARNLAEHLHWGLVSGQVSNTATSPLNVMALAVLTKLTGNSVLAAGVLYVVCVALTFSAVRRLVPSVDDAATAVLWPLAITALVELNPIMVASAGLESALFVMLLAWLLVAGETRNALLFGVLTGALILTRPDGVLFAVILVFSLGRSVKKWAMAVGASIAIVAPWVLTSWFLLGSAVPDTVLLKRHQLPWHGHSFGTGLLLYVGQYPFAVITAVAIPAVCVLALCVVCTIRSSPEATSSRRSRPAVLLILAGFGHYAAYTRLHPPPYHWYYGLSFSAITLGALVLLVRRYRQRLSLRWMAGVLAVMSLAVLVNNGFTAFAPITTNWQSSAEAEGMAKAVGEIVGDDTVEFHGEIGAFAYFCDCKVVDDFSDMARLNSVILQDLQTTTGSRNALLRLNYRHRDLTGEPTSGRYLLQATNDPGGQPWRWPASSPWTIDDPGYYVLTRIPGP